MTVTEQNLFNLTYDLATELGVVTTGIATGGSPTTLEDTVERLEEDDFWNLGTLWLLHDAGGSGNIPEGYQSVIKDFVNSTSVITLVDTWGQAVAIGDQYAVSTSLYPNNDMIVAINRALRKMGTIHLVDKTLTTASNTTLYDLPSAAFYDIRTVEIATDKNSSNPDYIPVIDYDIERTASGTADKLIIPDRWGTGYTIKIDYMGLHPTLRTDTDSLNENVHPDLPMSIAAITLLMKRKQQPGASGDKTLNEQLNYFMDMRDSFMEDRDIERPGKASKLYPVRAMTSSRRYPGDRNPR